MRDFDSRVLDRAGAPIALRVEAAHRHALVAEVVDPMPGTSFFAREPGCRRVVLLHPARTLVPLGVRFDDEAAWEALEKAVGASLSLGTRRPAAASTIALEGPGVDLRVRPWTQSEALACAGRRLRQCAVVGDLWEVSDPIGRALDQRLSTLAARIASGDLGAGHGLTRPLVGLGHGSTPSGDDMLTGALAVLWARDSARCVAARQAIAREIDGLTPDRTTRTSLDMLWNAARGAFPAALCDVVQALGDGAVAAGAFDALVEALLRLGATSGRDLWRGVAALAEAEVALGRGAAP